MGKYEAAYTFLKQHPYRLREALTMSKVGRATGITPWNMPLIIYAVLISVQLRRKVRPAISSLPPAPRPLPPTFALSPHACPVRGGSNGLLTSGPAVLHWRPDEPTYCRAGRAEAANNHRDS